MTHPKGLVRAALHPHRSIPGCDDIDDYGFRFGSWMRSGSTERRAGASASGVERSKSRERGDLAHGADDTVKTAGFVKMDGVGRPGTAVPDDCREVRAGHA
jgi:hypothetical protein